MIRSRRVAHRAMVHALAVIVPLVLVAGLALRPEVPPASSPDHPLFRDAGYAQSSSLAPRRIDAGGHSFEIFVQPSPGAENVLATRPTAVILEPDLLVYWAPDAGPAATTTCPDSVSTT